MLKKLGKYGLTFSEQDLDLLQELCIFLSPFRDVTILINEASPNLVCIPLMATKVRNACFPRLGKSGQVLDSQPIKQLKRLIKESIDKCLCINTLVQVACCFDPGVRNAVLSHDQCECHHELESSRYRNNIFVATSGQNDSASTFAQQAYVDAAGPTDVKRLTISLIKETTRNPEDGDVNVALHPLQHEVGNYPSLNDDASALDFWKKNETSFPILSAMAKAVSFYLI